MIVNQKFSGRKKISLPISKEDFLSNPTAYLKNLMGKSISMHRNNCYDFDKIEEELLQNISIYTKTRDDDSSINNKTVENIIYRIWKSKVSYTVGRPIQYSSKDGEVNDDITYLSKYIEDCHKSSNDILVYGDLYEYGVAYRIVYPKDKTVNLESESPVEDYYCDPRNVFTAYTSDVKEEELFSCIISEKYDISKKKKVKRYKIYFTDEADDCFSLLLNEKYEVVEGSAGYTAWKYNPVVEYSLPKRIGAIEILIPLQTTLNFLESLQIDDIEQFVQSYLVFVNQDADLETDEGIKNWENQNKIMRKTRSIVLKTDDPQKPVDLKILSETLNHQDINDFRETIKNALYSIGGSAIPSQDGTSGADTSGSRMLANGYQNALFDANLDTTYVKRSEYKWLRFLLAVCKEYTENKIDETNYNSIDIKYDITMSDNILSKAQAIQYLFNSKMPPSLILKVVPMLSDIFGSAKIWEAYMNEIAENENINENKELKNLNENQIKDIEFKGNTLS